MEEVVIAAGVGDSVLVRKEGTRGDCELGGDWVKSSIFLPDMVEEEDVGCGNGDCSGGKGSVGGELMTATERQQVSKEVGREKIPRRIRMC